MSTYVLITGASRGLGRELASLYLARPNYTVIAANRDPSSSQSLSLHDFPTGENTKLIIVKLDAASDTDAPAAIETLKTQHGIERLDIVIANAGIAYVWPKVEDVKIEDMRKHFEVNVLGVVRLWQATLGLLRKGNDPKWITLGSQSGLLEVCLYYVVAIVCLRGILTNMFCSECSEQRHAL